MQCILTGKNKILLLLRHYSFHIRQLACSKNSNKNFNRFYFTCLLIDDLKLVSCKVHIEFISCFVLHVHGGIYLCFPLGKIMFELTKAYAIRMIGFIFFPE